MTDQTAQPDWLRIKSNIKKLVDGGAAQSDIDAYIEHEGVTPQQVSAAPTLSALRDGPVLSRVKYYGDKVATGAAATVGFMGDLPALAGKASPWVADKLSTAIFGHPITAEEKAAAEKRPWSHMADTLSLPAPTTADIRSMMPIATGEAPNRLEKMLGTGVEFATTVGLTGGAGLAGNAMNAIKIGLPAGITSEAAGQMTEGTPYEPYARVVGALFGGGIPAGVSAWRGANAKAISQALDGITGDQYAAADQLMQEATRRGTNLTGAEALAKVTGRSAILQLQRAAEESLRGGGAMADLMGQRATGNAGAVNQQLNQIGPTLTSPATIGPRVQQAGQAAIQSTPEGQSALATNQALGPGMMSEQAGQAIRSDLQRGVGLGTGERVAQTGPMFDAARASNARVNIDPVITKVAGYMQQAKGGMQSKAAEALAALKVGNTLAGVPDTSISGLMESRKALGDMISQATRAGDNSAAAMLMDIRGELDNALAGVPSVAQANDTFRLVSRDLVDPYTKSPTVARALETNQFGDRFTLPAEKIPGMFQGGGPTAVDDLLRAGGKPSRAAFEQALVSDLRRSATNDAGQIDAAKLAAFNERNAPVLQRFPDLQKRVGNALSAQRALDDLAGTPLGQIAATNSATKQAAILLGKDPKFIGPHDVAKVMRHLVKQDPEAASAFVRQHLDDTFAQQAGNLLSGPNAQGGANFAKALTGNSKAAKNLQAAVTALPNGATSWAGFKNLLNVFEAQGLRLPANSATAGKMEIGATLSGGKFSAVVGPTTFLKGWYRDFTRGQNTNQLAQIFTNPQSVKKLRDLAFTKPGDAKAAFLAAELLGYDAQAQAEQQLRIKSGRAPSVSLLPDFSNHDPLGILP